MIIYSVSSNCLTAIYNTTNLVLQNTNISDEIPNILNRFGKIKLTQYSSKLILYTKLL